MQLNLGKFSRLKRRAEMLEYLIKFLCFLIHSIQWFLTIIHTSFNLIYGTRIVARLSHACPLDIQNEVWLKGFGNITHIRREYIRSLHEIKF